MRVKLVNNIGNVKEVKLGFSWTVLFFGFFVPFLRGDLKWGVIMLLVEIAVGTFTMGLGALIVTLAFAIFYNKTFVNELIGKGYKAASETDEAVLRQKL